MTNTDLKNELSAMGAEVVEKGNKHFISYKGSQMDFFPQNNASDSLVEFISFKKERDAFLEKQSITSRIMHENGLSDFYENEPFAVTLRIPGKMDQYVWVPAKTSNAAEIFDRRLKQVKERFGL